MAAAHQPQGRLVVLGRQSAIFLFAAGVAPGGGIVQHAGMTPAAAPRLTLDLALVCGSCHDVLIHTNEKRSTMNHG